MKRDGEVYNVSVHNEIMKLEIVKTNLKKLGRTEILITYFTNRASHNLRYTIDSTKLMIKLGWKPKYTFKIGIGPTIKLILENKEWINNVLSGESMRFMEVNYK